MSTNWGYVCTSHVPHIESEHWYNHGEDLLTTIYVFERAGMWPDRRVGGEHGWDEPINVPVGGEYANNWPVLWLRSHPECNVELANEYGDRERLPQWKPDGVRKNLQRRIELLHEQIAVFDQIAEQARSSAAKGDES